MKRKVRLATPTAQAIKTVVKKEMARETENKFVSTYVRGDNGAQFIPDATAPNPADSMSQMYITQKCNANSDLYRILPSITQGLTTLDRIGTVIRPKYMKSHIQFALAGEQTGSQNYQVRLMAFTLKQVKGYEAFLSGSLNYGGLMFWNGANGQSTGVPGGQPWWLNLALNKREVNVIHDEQFTLSKGTGTARVSSVGGTPGTQTFLAGYQGVKECEIHFKDLPATWKYDTNATGGASYPTNYAPFIAVIYTQMDGRMSQDPADQNKQIVMNIKTNLSYEDA